MPIMEDNSEINPVTENSKPTTTGEKLKIIFKNITIEPAVVLGALSHSISFVTIQHLLLEKACRVNLDLGSNICNALTSRNASYPDYKLHEQNVQILVANMLIWREAISSIVPCLLLPFIGAWSDRHDKRKQIVLNIFMADVVITSSYVLFTFFFKQVELGIVVLFQALVQALSGGFNVGQVGIMSYLSGVSTEKNRTSRISVFFFAISVSLCIGCFLSGILFELMGFYGVFCLALILQGTALLYGTFFVKDIWEYEILKGKVYETSGNFFKDLFDFQQASKTFRVVFKKREGRSRKTIWLLLILNLIFVGTIRGELNITYYYVKYKFGWSPVEFSLFNTLESISIVTGNFISLILFVRFFKLHDAILGIISSFSHLLAKLCYSLGSTSAFMYTGAVIKLFCDISVIAVKSQASKLVTPDELGKLYSIISLVDTFAPFVYNTLHNKIYATTLNTFPGTFYIVGIVSISFGVGIFGWLYLQWKKEQKQKSSEKNLSNNDKLLLK